eukprot:TRINITY_DN1750_c0_g1_i1.p1 TRINITY_DN1750_c0_g1~~TRINITY_DN1750_c0_g1_i1.p1  ORF type:complete len:325 (-),score=56.76 TRINITY_DN1750_c0_g1_i1:58-1032(-)
MAESSGSSSGNNSIPVKWSGKEFAVPITPSTKILDFKRDLHILTNVPPVRQKILGFKLANGKAPSDEDLVVELKYSGKIMLMGTPDDKMIAQVEETFDDVVNDLEDIHTDETKAEQDKEENIMKIRNRIAKYKPLLLNPPRPGKKLLVLDIDYTLFDHRSTVERASELMRPYLHEFLEASYQHYDIMIWSATSMKWIELKMKELGVATNPNYKITAYFDALAMITVTTPKYGTFNAKPLAVVWGLFPDYHPENTIMFDDLRRNFIMNPQNGLKIQPFREAPLNRDKDVELLNLTTYLTLIASMPDFSSLDHDRWEKFVKKNVNK